MKKRYIISVLLICLCAVFCLCSCGKRKKNRFSVDPEMLRLMQKTQAELTACVERCRSAAKESKDSEILLALANSQQVLVDRHEAIISILLKKNKLDRASTASYTVEMDPRMLVLTPVEEYRKYLINATTESTLREVLIALEITNKVLESDMNIELMIDPDAEEAPDIDFYLCPVCGQLTLMEPSENCPVCHSDKERQIKLHDGDLPPQQEGTYITVKDE